MTAIDLDKSYLITGSQDRTIKIWNATSLHLIRTLNGFDGSVLCLQFQNDYLVSGSDAGTISIWSVRNGNCLRQLFGHNEMVLSIRIDSRKIVSSTYRGEIKIWNFADALNLEIPDFEVCKTTFSFVGIVYSLQFDDFYLYNR